LANALFSPGIGGAYFGAANTAVNYAALGTTLGYGVGFFGPGAAIAGLEYGAQAIGTCQATALGATGIVVGAYNEIPNYLEEASARGVNAFGLNNSIYYPLDATGNGWTANQAFLSAGIESGQTFYYSSTPYLSGGLGYLNEVLYLAGRGVPLSPLP
jgi:hypothetical protein